MTKLWILFGLLNVTACLPQPASDVQKAKAELVIQGRILQGSEAQAGSTAIFIEQEPTAEGMAGEDGSFALTLDEARLDALRLRYGLQDPLLSLYFVREKDQPESAVLSVLNLQNRGAMNLGDVQLQAETPVTGRVMAYGAPVADARVRLGRTELRTAADGTFSGALPLQIATPLLVEKRGFVQTRGTWLPGDQERSIDLYSDLTPAGSIEAQPIARNLGNQAISFSYAANGAARWIRFANIPEPLSGPYVAEAPWQDLRQPLQVLMTSSTVYYQFADRDQKTLGPILSYTPTVSEVK